MNMIFERKFRGSCVVATSRKTATNKQTNKEEEDKEEQQNCE